ncbi:Na/Pi symporter [Primorskyibacter aestuariivivens]|uniref:Na/Pi cotransporter family protein n=1 Tax=Primorskyibacter aestuariivivens TaxID=1888912 RepID=UPI0023014389|nr:Na/Pi symporter [Primorskyibacter aestuariivivens]MDA7430632.1 Na/Pi symporter [Primorskyibacter aestuariivivens]
MSGAILLLFAVRFLRVGVERLWSAQIRAMLGNSTALPVSLAKGAALGFVMQGATVVLLMVSGLTGSGTIPAATAVLLAMGADFGSAVAVQFLTLPVSALGPLALLGGGWAYLNARQAKARHLGRVFLGLGLIFLSLNVIRDAVEPLKSMAGAPSLLAFINSDPVSAAIFGIALTLLMHSSLAAILTALSFAALGVIEPLAGLGFVFGCNAGSAVLGAWLLRRDTGPGLDIARSVALLRCALAAIAVAGLLAGQTHVLDALKWPASAVMLAGHLVFNFLFLFLAPISQRLAIWFGSLSDDGRRTERFELPHNETDPDVIIATMKSHAGQMLDILKKMLDELECPNPNTEEVGACEKRMNQALSDLREGYSDLPDLPETPTSQVHVLLDFAIRVESCGDICSGKLLNIQEERLRGEYKFSNDGQHEIDEMFAGLRKAILLSQTVLWTRRLEDARALVQHKAAISTLEEESRRSHLDRVGRANLTSLSSSNQHLEMISGLKTANSKLATIGYAVLDEHGALKKTRMKSKPKSGTN